MNFSLLTEIKLFLQKYWFELLALVGVLAVIALFIAASTSFLGYIAGLPGFRFDPFVLVGMTVGLVLVFRISNATTKALAQQTLILERLYKLEMENKKQSTHVDTRARKTTSTTARSRKTTSKK